MRNKSKTFYDLRKILSYNRPVNLIVGGRGIGKTLSVLDYCADEWLKENENNKFLYIRRYKSEVTGSKMEKLIHQLSNLDGYDNYRFRYNRGKFQIAKSNGEDAEKLTYITFGETITLTQALQSKGGDFSEFKNFIFDEFIITGNTLHYIRNEEIDFLELCETMFRNRLDIKFFMLSNSYDMINPYFSMLNFNIADYGIYRLREIVLIHMVETSEAIRALKQNSITSKLGGDRYNAYAINNEFYLQNGLNVIPKKPADAKPQITVKLHSTYFTIWYSTSLHGYYATSQMFANCERNYVAYIEEIETGYIYCKGSRLGKHYKRAMSAGMFFFQSEKIKEMCIEFCNRV